jgi:acetyl/propionyl-CoA carboxylase alpha subunit
MRYRFQVGENVYSIDLERQGESYRAVIDDETYDLQVLGQQEGEITLLLGGRPQTIYFATHEGKKWISLGGCTYVLEKPSAASKRRQSDAAAAGLVRAPMPAQVRALHVAEGEAVQKGDTLLLLEAMKMEIRIQAPREGTVKRLLVSLEQTVARDQVLLEMEE